MRTQDLPRQAHLIEIDLLPKRAGVVAVKMVVMVVPHKVVFPHKLGNGIEISEMAEAEEGEGEQAGAAEEQAGGWHRRNRRDPRRDRQGRRA